MATVHSEMARLIGSSPDVLPEYWPISGIELACDVCGETAETLYFESGGHAIVCGQHRVQA